MPVEFLRRSCGQSRAERDRSRGGDGQIVVFCMRTAVPWLLNAVTSRTSDAPEGLGGSAGAPGCFLVNGRPVREVRKMAMSSQEEVVTETPGGGGYGAVDARRGEARSTSLPLR